MDRVNHPTAPGGVFQDKVPGVENTGSTVPAAHMNAVQEELVRTIEAAGLAPDAGNLDQLTEAITRLGGGTGATTNLVVNGGMRFSQRGSTFAVTPTAQYTLDRWEAQSDSVGGTGRVTITPERDGQETDVGPGVWRYLRCQSTAQPNGIGPQLRTKLEVVRETSGRQLTLSMVLRASSITPVEVQVVQAGFGLNNLVLDVTDNVTTDWQRFTWTFDVPQVPDVQSPELAGTVTIQLRFPSIQLASVDVGQVQLEFGPVATDFREPDFAAELARCRRYYQKSYPLDVTPGVADGSPVGLVIDGFRGEAARSVQFVPEMRVAPSVEIFAPGGNAGSIEIQGGGPTVVNNIVGTSTARLGKLEAAIALSIEFIGAFFHYTADAEI